MRRRELAWALGLALSIAGCSGAPEERPPVRTTLGLDTLPAVAAYDDLRLDIGEPSARRYLDQGWSWDERQEDGRTFAWATGNTATVRIPLTPGKPLRFEAEMSTWEDAEHAPAPVTILLNGEEIGTIEPARGWRPIRFTLPAVLEAEGTLSFVHTQHMEVEGRRPVASAWDRIRISSEGVPSRSEARDLGTPGQRSWLEDGWSHDETHADGTTFVWSDGPASTLRIPHATQGASMLRMRMRSLAAAEPSEPQLVRLTLGEEALATLRVGTEWTVYEVPIPRGALSTVSTELRATYAYTVKPAERSGSTDVRDLAVAWDWVALEPRPDDGAIEAGTSTRLPVRLPPGTRLSFAPSERPETPSSLVISVTDPATGESRHHHLGRGGDVEIARPDAAEATVVLTLRHLASRGTVDLQDLALEVEEEASFAVPRPDVFVFVVDSLRADHTSAYGSLRETTPELTRFARSGALFTRAQAQASWTRPSSASLLTGMLPREHGATDRDDGLSPSARTTAEVLGALGYETAAFVTNGNIGEGSGLGQGFDHFFEAGGPPSAALPGAADEVVDAVLAWLDNRASPDRPLFLYVHVIDPHGPYAPAPQWRDRFAPDVPRAVGTTAWLTDVREGRIALEPDLVDAALDLYDAEIASTDAAFGAFVDGIDSRGIGDEAIVLFTSDHGEEFQDHGGMEHGRTLHREVLDVPFVLRAPGVEADARLAYPAQHIDFLPTVLHAVDAAIPPSLAGSPLQAIDPEQPRTTRAHLDLDGRRYEAAVRWPHKVIRSLDGSVPPQWFDLSRDPLERAPSAQRPAEAEPLDTALDAHAAPMDASGQ